MSLMIIAGVLFFIRIHRWPRFKRENDYTDADIRKHQQKLIIYTIIFAVGFFIFAVEIIFRKYL